MDSILRISLIVCLYFHVCHGYNILLFCGYGEGSHFTTTAVLGNELIYRGHNVTALISNAYAHRADEAKYGNMKFEIFTHNFPPEEVRSRFDRMTESAMKGSLFTDSLSNISMLLEEVRDDCEAIFDDRALLERLAAAEFDIALIDPMWACSMIVAEFAAKRFVVVMGTAWMNHLARPCGNPSNPALSPEMNTGFTNRMTFLQRVSNTVMAVFGIWAISTSNTFTSIQHSQGISPDLETSELYARAQLVLVNIDFVMEFPIPLQPHFIAVGGLSTGPAYTLEKDLEEFVQSSGDAGIIIFSLGTYVTFLKEELIGVFADAFALLPQKVVWQFRGRPPPVLDNRPYIRTMPWIPQNDLLGHNKTRAFMYQGGNNGLYEALYHAVPLVIIPLIGDQPDVAARVRSRGMGLSLDMTTITSEKIVEALSTVINDKKYKETAERLSAIYRDRPMRPVETAAFWIEHVIKHGGEYMRSPIHDLTWYQYYLLDVIAFLVVIVIALVVVLLCLCRFALRCCSRMFGSKTKAD